MGYLKQVTREVERFKKSQATARKAQRTADRERKQLTGLMGAEVSMMFDEDFPSDFTDAVQRRITRAAVRKAANEVKKAQKKAIKRHQSSKTGTSELWTEKGKERNAKRVGLYKSIKTSVRYDKETRAIIGSVGPGPMDAWIGWFFEMGRKRVLWGREPVNLPDVVAPQPFVRPAGAQTRGKQKQIIEGHVKQNWEKA
jgi:hypothetical protein